MLLLDTCSLVWLASDLTQFSPTASRAILDNRAGLFVSSISAFEIGIKVNKGKIVLPSPTDRWFAEVLRLHAVQEVPVSSAIAFVATGLPPLHNDPFDRLIVATALARGMPVVTPDRLIHAYPGVDAVW